MSRKKLYLILSFLLLFGLCLQFLTLPMIRKAKDTKLKLEERMAYLAERKKVIERIEALRQEYKLREDQVERLDAALPTESDLSNLIFQLQNLAADSGMMMKTFGYSESEEKDFRGAKAVIVSNELLGSYQSLKIFLRKLENNLRIANVQGVDFSAEIAKAGEEAGSQIEPIFLVNLTTKFYYFPVQKEIGG